MTPSGIEYKAFCVRFEIRVPAMAMAFEMYFDVQYEFLGRVDNEISKV